MVWAKTISYCLLFFLAAAGSPLRSQLKYGPYLQNASPDKITIMWRTVSTDPCMLEYYKTGDATNVLHLSEDSGLYEVTLSGLNPGSEYSYRIVSSSFTSAWYSFFTPPSYTTKLRFTFVSDCEDNGLPYKRMEANLKRQLQFAPDFILLGGDLVDRGDADGVRYYQDQWADYLQSLSVIASSRSYWPAVGNHDIDFDYSFSNYLKVHSLPETEEYYSFRYGSAHIISLSVRGCAVYSNQYLWLERDLARAAADSTVKFIFAFMHFSGYSSGYYNNRDSMLFFEELSGIPYPNLVRDIYPLFERYRVSAVFSGHDHHYERTYPIRNDAVNSEGIYYFVVGGGGSYNNPTKGPSWWTAKMSPQRDFLHFLLVDVNGDSATIRCVPVDTKWGETYDSVVVTAKKPQKYEPPKNAPNALILLPTPSRDEAELFYYGPTEMFAEYRVFNILGQEVLRSEIAGAVQSGMRWRLDLSRLSSGIYFCIFKSERVTMSTKFVKVQ